MSFVVQTFVAEFGGRCWQRRPLRIVKAVSNKNVLSRSQNCLLMRCGWVGCKCLTLALGRVNNCHVWLVKMLTYTEMESRNKLEAISKNLSQDRHCGELSVSVRLCWFGVCSCECHFRLYVFSCNRQSAPI